MRYLTAGESHGRFLCGILEGLPYGIKVSRDYIARNLRKRREMPGRSERLKSEDDRFEIISGMYKSKTTGMPLCILIENRKRERYKDRYVPLHGEYFGALKYGHRYYSVARERLSQRETAVRVALFSFTRKMVEDLGVKIESKVLRCNGVDNPKDFEGLIRRFKEEGNSFGGVFEVRIKNLVPGIGGFSQGFERLQSKISSIIYSIGSIKGVEFGAGFSSDRYTSVDFFKNPSLLGGIEGGVSRGDDIVVRCVTRPLAGVKRISPESVSDVTSVFAAAYISEFLLSYVIADEIMKKFGSDEFERIKEGYFKWRESM